MGPNNGFGKAKELLQEHYGNEFKIASAYIEKALSWSPITREDSKALEGFALYLRGCRNAIAEIAYLEELDLSSNLQSLVAKLPFKLRERWRTEAYKLPERRHSREKRESVLGVSNQGT